MGEIKILGKWDLNNKTWDINPPKKLYGRSLAISSYKKTINNKRKINYIIFNYGSRVEDHSKDYIKINKKEAGIKLFLNYFSGNNYDIKLLLMDADAPIIEAAKYFAKYIEDIANLPTTNTINLIGLSKGGIMNFYIPRFLNNQNTFSKINIFNIATPYEGTKMASPLFLYPEIKKIISKKIHNKKLSNIIYNKLINIYENISSNSHMDYDIAIADGIPKTKLDNYDERTIKEIFSDKNIAAIKKIKNFKNFVTIIDKNTLKEAILTLNIKGILLCISNNILFNKLSDGMVHISSQQKIDNIINIKSYKLLSTHHDIISNKKALNEVLSIVNNTISI